MPIVRSLLPTLFAFAVLSCAAPRVHAQIHRCTAADGTEVFTDRKCADIDAIDRTPRTPPSAGAGRLYRGGCARNLQDLTYEITTAIDAQDANRLAGVYHWVGVSSNNAAALMDRLDAVVHRPLVDIVPIAARSTVDEGGGESDAYYPSTIPQRQPPVALRVEQTLGNGTTPSHTIFSLQKHLGCWWVRF
jgi:hypothetical protein